MPDLVTRQGLSRLLTITDHNRDFSGKQLTAKLLDFTGEETQVGSALGEPPGTPIPLNVNFASVPAGHYHLRVCGPTEIVFPPDDTTFTVQIKEGC